MDQRVPVEMLWESADPHRELTRRFGFSDGGAVEAWVAEVLDRCWGLDMARCDRVVISGQNAMAWIEVRNRRLIVKWSSLPARFAHLEEAARLVAWLAAQGLPVAGPVAATDGRLLVELGDEAKGHLRTRLPRRESRFLLGVLPVVSGELLAVDDPDQLDDAGRMLATFHQALAAYPGQLSGRSRGAGMQLVHNDFRSANLVHDGAGITAVLDFEEVTYDSRVADLAKSAVLLATRYRDWGPTTGATRAAYVEAYERHAADPLTEAERRDLDRCVAGHLKGFGWT